MNRSLRFQIVASIIILVTLAAILFFSVAISVGGDTRLLQRRFVLMELDYYDTSLPLLFLEWLGHIVQFDWGTSISARMPITKFIGEYLPASLELPAISALVSTLLILLLNQFKPKGRIQLLLRLFAAAPPFAVALLLLVVAIRIEEPRIPLSGRSPPYSGGIAPLFDRLEYLFLPVLTLTMYIVGRYWIRIVRTKRGKVSPLVVLREEWGGLLSMLVAVELVFGWPGVGRLSIIALTRLDLPLAIGTILTLTGLSLIVVVVTSYFVSSDETETQYLATGQRQQQILDENPLERLSRRIDPPVVYVKYEMDDILERLQHGPTASLRTERTMQQEIKLNLMSIFSINLTNRKGKTSSTQPTVNYTSNRANIARAILMFLAVVMFIAPLFTGDPYRTDIQARMVNPGEMGHVLGTDSLGRDQLDRLLVATSTSLKIAFFAAGIATVIGVGLATYLQEQFSAALDFVVGFTQSVPLLILLAYLTSLAQPSNTELAIILGITLCGFVVEAWHRQLVSTSNSQGIGRFLGVFLYASATIVLYQATLDFFGFGVRPPEASWGFMLAEGREFIFTASHLIYSTVIPLVACAGLLYYASDVTGGELE